MGMPVWDVVSCFLCGYCLIVQLLFYGRDVFFQTAIAMPDLFFDLFDGRHYGGMVASTEEFADLREGDFSFFAQQVHRDLAGIGNFLCAVAS